MEVPPTTLHETGIPPPLLDETGAQACIFLSSSFTINLKYAYTLDILIHQIVHMEYFDDTLLILQIFIPLCIFTARKRSLRRLCFYRCVSVHGGVGIPGPPQMENPPWMETPPGWRTPPDGEPPLDGEPPPGWRTPPLVNVRVVRILLECILVEYMRSALLSLWSENFS